MCATACAPSTSTGIPRACAFSTIAAIGLIVPSEFDTWTTATIFVRSVRRPSTQIHPQLAFVGDRNHLELRALLLADELPRDDVRVVLHLGDEHLVALADIRAAERLRDQVDGLGRAAHEDDLARVRRVQELLHLVAGLLVGARRPLAQQVHAAMDVGVVLGVAAHHRVDDGLRLLRRGGVVEIDERLAVDLLVQDGEVLPDSLDVEGRRDAAPCAWRRVLLDMGQTRRQDAFQICRAPARSSPGSGCRRRTRARASRALRRRPARATAGRTSPRRRAGRWPRRACT